jgi:hypothetical protein
MARRQPSPRIHIYGIHIYGIHIYGIHIYGIHIYGTHSMAGALPLRDYGPVAHGGCRPV